MNIRIAPQEGKRPSQSTYRFAVDSGEEQNLVTVPRVTTILNSVPKPELRFWREYGIVDAAIDAAPRMQEWIDSAGIKAVRNELVQAPFEASKPQREIGSAVHRQIESIIKGGHRPLVPPDVDGEQVRLCLAQYEAFASRYQPEYLASELTVVNMTHGWAGTLDAIARIDTDAGPRTLLLDIKTSAPRKDGSPGIYIDYCLQCAAYRHAEYAVDRFTNQSWDMPETDGAAILWIGRDEYALIELQADEDIYRLFRMVHEIHTRLATPKDKDWYWMGDIRPAHGAEVAA